MLDISSALPAKPSLDLHTIAQNRSAYNRMIGELVNLEMDCHCEDLPDLADLGYTSEFMIRVFGSKIK
jgi:hypothetical protein